MTTQRLIALKQYLSDITKVSELWECSNKQVLLKLRTEFLVIPNHLSGFIPRVTGCCGGGPAHSAGAAGPC